MLGAVMAVTLVGQAQAAEPATWKVIASPTGYGVYLDVEGPKPPLGWAAPIASYFCQRDAPELRIHVRVPAEYGIVDSRPRAASQRIQVRAVSGPVVEQTAARVDLHPHGGEAILWFDVPKTSPLATSLARGHGLGVMAGDVELAIVPQVPAPIWGRLAGQCQGLARG